MQQDKEKKLKHIIYLLIGIIALLVIISFKNPILDVVTGNTPEKVVKACFQAMIEGDYEKFIALQSQDEVEQYARKYSLTYEELIKATKEQFTQLHRATVENGITMSDYKITVPSSYQDRTLVYVKVEYLGYNESIPKEMYVPVKRDLNKVWYIPQDKREYGNLNYDFNEMAEEVQEETMPEISEEFTDVTYDEWELPEDYVPENTSTDYYEPGIVYHQDLDGDGQIEEIELMVTYGYQESYTIDGIRINQQTYPIDKVDTQVQLCIVDIDRTDGFSEIAISTDGYSSDYTTKFYRYKNGQIEQIGYVDGKFDEVYLLNKYRRIEINGDGLVHTYIRNDNLQTYLYDVTYKLSDYGMELVYADYYEIDTEVILLRDLDVLMEPIKYSDIAHTIWEGQKAYLRAYYGDFVTDSGWYYIENEQKQGGWFNVEEGTVWPIGYNKYEVFEGLFIAD